MAENIKWLEDDDISDADDVFLDVLTGGCDVERVKFLLENKYPFPKHIIDVIKETAAHMLITFEHGNPCTVANPDYMI